ncbi:MAG: response regulator [Methylocystis sp.]|nr:response regulator [Methylocystis sp.]
MLVVEDETSLATLLVYNLEAEGYQVEHVDSGDEAELRLAESPPDLVILDWMLPGVSGLEICRRLRSRENFRDMPIIMLTARGEESERVRGLSVGADDYVVKPFSTPELMARVRALLRRARPERVASKLTLGELDLDRETRRVRRSGREIHLGPTEFRLLEYLMKNAGQVVTRTMLLENVWDYHFDPQTNVIDVHISRLRAKIDKGRDSPLLHTIRGAGYMIRDGAR